MISFSDKIKQLEYRQTPTTLRFLTLAEQQIATGILQQDVQFDGGYETAEKKRAYCFSDIEPDIICFQIIHDERYMTLTHQNILGTLMSLSITQDSIGDILPKQGRFFVTKEISDEIKRSFTMINHVPIELKEIDGQDTISEQDYTYHETLVHSLRLDLVVSKIGTMSRDMAQEWIQNEWVKLDHIVYTKPTKQVIDGTILSIRQRGRFEILDTTARTRKGKIVVKYRKFV